MNHRLSLALAVALAVGPVALLAQESSHPSGCSCPCHNQHPQSGAQGGDQGGTGGDPRDSTGAGTRTGDDPRSGGPGTRTGDDPRGPEAPGMRTGDDPNSQPPGMGQGDDPRSSQPPGMRQGGDPRSSQPPGMNQGGDPRTTPPGMNQGGDPRASQPPGLKTGGDPRASTPSVPGTSLPGHPGGCGCCSQRPQNPSSDPVVPVEPWVWVEWWDAQFVAAKEATIDEKSSVVKDTGGPWTLDWWTTSGPRAAMVFVYWSDTKDHRGYDSGMVQTNLWFDDDVACISRAFDCYRVDAKKAEKEALKHFKVKKVPTVLILDPDRKVIASIDKFGNGRAMTSVLEDTLKSKFPDRYREFLDGLKEVAKSFDEGKAAVQRQDFDVARDRLSFVVGHEFRTEDYPRAKELLAKSEKKLKK